MARMPGEGGKGGFPTDSPSPYSLPFRSESEKRLPSLPVLPITKAINGLRQPEAVPSAPFRLPAGSLSGRGPATGRENEGRVSPATSGSSCRAGRGILIMTTPRPSHDRAYWRAGQSLSSDAARSMSSASVPIPVASASAVSELGSGGDIAPVSAPFKAMPSRNITLSFLS